jgi:hypothetical protein
MAAAALLPSSLSAAAPAPAARALTQHYADSVVGVELVVTVKVKMGEREAPPREQRVEVNGTVISASGLTVTSLAEVDPEVAIEAMRASQRGPAKIELLGADFKEVKLRLADGTEVPARFVLKDADLDLAFMAPVGGTEEAKREFAHVDLARHVDGAVLDEFYFVSRAPKVLQRVPLMRATQVMGIVERPRRFYLLTENLLGSPAFDEQGGVLGIALQHFSNNRRTGFVVLPAEDIAEMAKQAEAAQHAPAQEAAAAEPAKE